MEFIADEFVSSSLFPCEPDFAVEGELIRLSLWSDAFLGGARSPSKVSFFWVSKQHD